MPTSSAATLIMYIGRSLTRRPASSARTHTRRRARPQRLRARPHSPSAVHTLQLLEQLAFLLVHALRHLDAHARENVALAAAAQLRSPTALDAQQLAVLRARRDLQRHGPARSGHLDGAAEGRRRERHRYLHDQIVAAPLVGVGGRDTGEDDEVACRTAVLPRLTLALEANARAVLHAGLDLHGVRLDAALAPGPLAVWARLLDDCPVPAATRAWL